MNKIIAMVRKELIDAARDKRSVMAGLYYAIGTPLIMCGLFMVLIGQLTSPDDLKISITNPDKAPDLVRFLSNKGITQGEAGAKDLKAIELIISPDYAKQMNQGKGAEITIVADNSEEKLQNSIRRLEKQLQAYSAEMGSLRLIARGIDPRVVQPIKVNVHDQATTDSKGGMILGIAIFTMIYSVFISGMNLAIDTSAGERERNSLALLLSHPLTTRQLVLSKIITVGLFALLGLVLILLVSKVAYTFVPWQELGFSVSITSEFMALMLLVGIPVALMAACLQLFVSFMAKTFKEAQSYLTMVLFVPLALSMAASYNIAPDVLQWLPVSGQQQALMDFIKGKDMNMLQLLVSTLGTLAIALVLAFGMEKSLKSEKVIFGL
ncbi:ABC transporter permease [Shewanella oneidensis MR-1]|uniref:ABC-type sodium efflux system permease component NatB n=1 Tax=Shewanella oneidensis (strain ATCC 700550 / JCM 31522 / CIP 106686 / LMG 19005 / NCIMB 14063 / MR-1) TaxID=211586 RepID=Q8EKM3_SHEON|nr:ABC transporter permease [Shewanella oneidensis]AAN53156.1 ABC-type sodium efflux system permease component NatB [Shewanella oneidensis MR-1]MDX5997944.1 ABC transporter permease [Shewanella oneidensis]MEE2026906.1 ABC transporter permease protein NatB [Shewanella oneidensis]QKG95053.1 ABC transporter permease [Shewanella oneidensis MR-1]